MKVSKQLFSTNLSRCLMVRALLGMEVNRVQFPTAAPIYIKL